MGSTNLNQILMDVTMMVKCVSEKVIFKQLIKLNMETILNAEIKSTSFYFEDHGCLTFDIGFEHQRGHQCMGGYCIGHGIINEDDEEHITGTKKGTEAMARIMWAVGVKSWEDLKGKYCRVKFDEENGRLTSVGHIVKDKWFNLVEYMKRKD